MREAKLEPDIISYSAGISACEKGGQWQRALARMSEMREAKLEPSVISYNAWTSACEKGRAVEVGSGAAERDVGPEAFAQRTQLQPCDRHFAWERRCDRRVSYTVHCLGT
ncbi:unnamed protein product, partial [Prorocentrum cordatum]